MFVSNKLFASIFMLSATALVAGCDNGGSSTGSSSGNGSFTLGITDGPVDSAAKVVIEFTGVSIKPAGGEAVEYLFDEPKTLDLLTLQGSASENLLTNQTVTAGSYNWIRLHVNAVEGVKDSYMLMDDGTEVELRIPSGAETGLKLVSGFTIAAGGSADFTIDFDLRKSITQPPNSGHAMLRPALRIVDNMVVGTISGVIQNTLVTNACTDPTNDAGSVYVFAGADVTPSDISGASTDPLANALVHSTTEGYTYEVGFLAEGDYTVVYTCDAAGDDPMTANTLKFHGASNAQVLADLPVVVSFSLEVDAGVSTGTTAE